MSPKFKRILKRVAIAIVLLIGVALTVNGALAWMAVHRLQNKLSAIRAAGKPASLADLVPKSIPPENNAAVIIERINPQLDAFGEQYYEFYKTSLGKSLQDTEDQQQVPNAEQCAAMQAILDRYPDILRAVHQAAACPVYASLVDFKEPVDKFMDDVGKRSDRLRLLAHFVEWKIDIFVAEKKQDDAVQLGTELLRVAKLYGYQANLVQFLCSIALEAFAADEINVALRRSSFSRHVCATRPRIIS